MPAITLKDILIGARQEAAYMQHYYLGIEHLFVAMLQIQGGLTRTVLEQMGFNADQITYAVRLRTDRGTERRQWAGMPYTPRTEVVLDIAGDLAREAGRAEANERDVLDAILAERDSLPIRVMKVLGLSIDTWLQAVIEHHATTEPLPPSVQISTGPDWPLGWMLNREQLMVLRRMFNDHSTVRLDQRLTGYSDAQVLVATPIDHDGRESSPIVVKIGPIDTIIDEFQRYETHVRAALPLLTARLEEAPTIPKASALGGLKYTLVAGHESRPRDLRQVVQEEGFERVQQILQHDLYERFGRTWWIQRKPYRFQAWQEYDWLLPPILVLEPNRLEIGSSSHHVLRLPLTRAKLQARLSEVTFGDLVSLENFVVQKIDQQRGTLRLGNGRGTDAEKQAFRVEMRGLQLDNTQMTRGETIGQLTGCVWKTRRDILAEALQELDPDFDLTLDRMPFNDHDLPNPLNHYDDLLDHVIHGSISKIHGDLHLGNILLGLGDMAWLIDFGHTREGHVIFDWATLEVSLLGDSLISQTANQWNDARQLVQAVYTSGAEAIGDQDLRAAKRARAHIREIAAKCLTAPGVWAEYSAALALCALRAFTWRTLPIGGRRLMYVLSGQAIEDFFTSQSEKGAHVGREESDPTEHLRSPASPASLSPPLPGQPDT